MNHEQHIVQSTASWILALLIASSFLFVGNGTSDAQISKRDIEIGKIEVKQLQCKVYQCSAIIRNKSNSTQVAFVVRGYREGYTLFKKKMSLAGGSEKRFQSDFIRTADMDRFKLAVSSSGIKSVIREKAVNLTPITVEISDFQVSYDTRQKKSVWQATLKNSSPFSLCDFGVYANKLSKGEAPEPVGGESGIDLSPGSKIRLNRSFPGENTAMTVMLFVKDKSLQHEIARKTVRYMPGKSPNVKNKIMK